MRFRRKAKPEDKPKDGPKDGPTIPAYRYGVGSDGRREEIRGVVPSAWAQIGDGPMVVTGYREAHLSENVPVEKVVGLLLQHFGLRVVSETRYGHNGNHTKRILIEKRDTVE